MDATVPKPMCIVAGIAGSNSQSTTIYTKLRETIVTKKQSM